MRFTDFINTCYEANILPAIPPKADMSPSSNVHTSQLGKIPGKLTQNGWVGFAKWSYYESTAADLSTWDNWQGNICLNCGESFVGFDIDAEDEMFLAAVLTVLKIQLGSDTFPIRGRTGSNRILIVLAGNVRKRALKFVNTITGEEAGIDVVGNGGQFVLGPTHPTGAKYTWNNGDLCDYTYDDLIVVTEEMLEVILTEVTRNVEHTGWKLLSGKTSLRDPVGVADVQEYHKPTDDIDIDRMKAVLPNDYARLIKSGAPEGQRSEALAKITAKLIGLELTDNQIANILLNPNYGISTKPIHKGVNWLMEDIARMRAKFQRVRDEQQSDSSSHTTEVKSAATPESVVEVDLEQYSEEALARRISELEKHCAISAVEPILRDLLKVANQPIRNRLIALVKRQTGMHKPDIIEVMNSFKDEDVDNFADEVVLTHHQLAVKHIEYEVERDINTVCVGDSLFTLNDQMLWEPKPLSELISGMCNHMDGMDNFTRRGDYTAVQKQYLDLLNEPTFFASKPIGYAYNDGFFYSVKENKLHVEPLGPQHRVTWMVNGAPLSEDDGGNAKVWHDLLDQMFEGDDKEGQIRMLRETMCLSFLGYLPTVQLMPMLLGAPATGKSVLQEIWTSLFPTEAKVSVAPHLFSNEYYLIQLLGAAFNFVSELPEEKPIDDTMKQVADGSVVTGRHPAGKPISFRSHATNIFNANALPYLKDKTEASIRRFLILSMENTVAYKDRDPRLVKRITSDESVMGYILYWALSCANEVLENGIFESETSKRIKKEWMGASNNVVEFFNDETVFETDTLTAIPIKLAYGVYKSWCKSCGYKAYGRNNFLTLTSKCVDLKRTYHKKENPSGGKCVRGLSITAEGLDSMHINEALDLPSAFKMVSSI